MIIVSQDKTEIVNFDNVNSLWICPDEEGRFTIEATADTNTTLGYYETEERAKEVLQKITRLFSVTKINSSYQEAMLTIKFKKMSMYEMPEK